MRLVNLLELVGVSGLFRFRGSVVELSLGLVLQRVERALVCLASTVGLFVVPLDRFDGGVPRISQRLALGGLFEELAGLFRDEPLLNPSLVLLVVDSDERIPIRLGKPDQIGLGSRLLLRDLERAGLGSRLGFEIVDVLFVEQRSRLLSFRRLVDQDNLSF